MENNLKNLFSYMGFPGGSDSKGSACNAGDLGSIPGSRRSPGEGHSNPLQYSCLENSVLITIALTASVVIFHFILPLYECIRYFGPDSGLCCH